MPKGGAPDHLARSLSTQRLALVLLIGSVAIILALETWQVWRNYQNAFTTASTDVTNITLAVAQHADDAVKEAASLLVGIRERLADEPLERLDRPRVHRLLARQSGLLPQLHGLFVYDRHGHWLVTDKDSIPPQANNADREYFRYHLEHREDQLHVGEVITSRATGELIIPVSRRLEDANGEFAGVLLATIRLQYFIDYYARFQLDDRGAITLALGNGTLLVRRPFALERIGTSLANGDLFTRHLKYQPNGQALVKASVDGQERLYAYQQLDSYPIVALAGLSKKAILMSWQQDLLRSVTVVGILVLAMLVFGFTLLKQIRSGARTEAELRRAHDALQALTLEDSLTALGNRRRFDAVLPVELLRARRTGQPLALVMLDIDHFKAYNDHYGHPMGDHCIQAVAQQVATVCRRPGDLAIRYGGEEMALLLPDCDEIGAHTVATALQDRLRALQLPHERSPFGQVTVSMGYALYRPGEGLPLPETLLAEADQALYLAKNTGRNRIYPALCPY